MGSRARGADRFAPSRILIVDDHPIFRQALRDILREASVTDLEVVGEARDGQEAIELCRRLQPDLILMDVSMPGMDGLEATREIKREFPRTILLMLTAMEQPEYLAEALRAGASGYIVKDLSSQRLIDAIRRVLDGEFPINQELAAQLLGQLLDEAPKVEDSADATTPYIRSSPSEERPPRTTSPPPHVDDRLLTEREAEVLRLLARGQHNQQIARELLVSVSTVKKHVRQILSKLEASDRIQAVVKAIELGLLPEQRRG